VFSRVRFALTPGWLALHLLCLALVVTMVLLGRWQLDVSNSKHFSLQNFGYALQWWAFSGFVIVMWVRLLRDARRQRDGVPSGAAEVAASAASALAEGTSGAPNAVAYRRYVMPTSAEVVANADDPTRAAYNEYLAQLAAQDAVPGNDARNRAEGTAR
jgi:DNA-binding transcriptional regulator of glucitol operon